MGTPCDLQIFAGHCQPLPLHPGNPHAVEQGRQSGLTDAVVILGTHGRTRASGHSSKIFNSYAFGGSWMSPFW